MISSSVRFKVFKRDNFKCKYCGRSSDEVELTIDHVVPKCEDGTDAMFNLVTCCRDCNSGKGKIPLDQEKITKKNMEYEMTEYLKMHIRDYGGYETPICNESFLQRLVNKYPLFDIEFIMKKAIDFHEYDDYSNPVHNALRATNTLCRLYEEWKWTQVGKDSEEEESESSI